MTELLPLLIFAIVIALAAVFSFSAAYRYLGAKVVPQLRNVLESRLDKGSGYSFYTAGHPYYWVAVERDELIQQLYRHFVGFHGLSPQLLKEIRIDDQNKKVYIGITSGGTIVPVHKLNLQHYEC